MMRRFVTPVLVVVLFVAAGCSSDRTAEPSTPVESTTANAPSAVAEVTRAELDAQSVSWFEALCNGAKSVAEIESTADTSGLTDAQSQQKGVETLNGIGAAFSSTGVALAGMPPPTFEGGAQFAGVMAQGLQESGAQLAAVASSLAAVDPADTAALQQAVAQIEDEIGAALEPLSALGDLGPEVSAAAQGIPACQALG